MKDRIIKVLPKYLQPKILSAVAYVNEAAPNVDKAVERINTLQKHLSEKEIMWVMSLLTFEKLLDIVKDTTREFARISSRSEGEKSPSGPIRTDNVLASSRTLDLRLSLELTSANNNLEELSKFFKKSLSFVTSDI